MIRTAATTTRLLTTTGRNLLRCSKNGAVSANSAAAAVAAQRLAGISTNNRQQNTATAEPSCSTSDKYLHYTEQEGYFKTSPFPSVQPVNLPLDKYVWRDFKKWENKVATVCVITGRQYTYAELRDAAAALAVRLQTQFKLGKGDVLAICLPNLPEYPLATLGAIEASITVTTVNPIYTAEEIGRQLTFSNAKFIIGMASGYSVLQEACKLAQKSIPIALIKMRTDEQLPAGAIDFYEMIQHSGVDYSKLKQYDFHPDDMVFLPFSSGTTGLPKGVMLSHANVTANCEQTQQPYVTDTLTYQDTLPCVLPFFHIYGLTVVMLSKIGQGSRLATLPQFKPEDLIKSLHEYKASILNLVPPIALFMINHPKVTPEACPELRMVMSGAAPIGQSDVERFIKKFPNTKFLQGYGMTEASPVILLTPVNNTRYGSTGVLASNTEGKILPTDGKSQIGLGPNTPGELCVRGPQVMAGYLNNEEANKDTFHHPGRWLRTGDVAYYDDEGFFYITDRMKELIKVKGFQVPPAELENILRDNPKILEAAVFGIPNEATGELPRALVVLRPGMEATEGEIYEYVASRVAEYKKLDGGILFASEIPKNPTGKILRKELKEKFSS